MAIHHGHSTVTRILEKLGASHGDAHPESRQLRRLREADCLIKEFESSLGYIERSRLKNKTKHSIALHQCSFWQHTYYNWKDTQISVAY